MSSLSAGYVAVPCCSVTFDGTNYAEFVGFMRIHMRGLRLWGVLCGEVICPPRPVAPVAPIPPVPPVLAADASDVDKAAAKTADDAAMAAYDRQVSDYSDALATYRDDLATYAQWCDEDARAAAVLTASVLPQFASEFMILGSVAEMWTSLRQRYQPSGDSLYLSMVRQEHALQQGDSSIDEFYTQSSAIWRQLDSLCFVVCGTCSFCQITRSDLDFQRIHEFLSRLRPEFEPRRDNLFARGRVPLSEVLAELRAEETRLRGAGLLGVPTVLATRVPAPAAAMPTAATPLLPTPGGGSRPPSVGGGGRPFSGGGGRPPSGSSGRPRSRQFCGYCQRSGHPESDCFKKQRDLERASSSSSRGPPPIPATVSLTHQDIVQLKRLLAASGSSSSGIAGSVTGSPSVERPPLPSTRSGSSHEDSGWGWPSAP